MMSDAERELARSWDDNAGVWAEAVRTQSLESRRLVTDSAILEAVRACGGRRVLDVGCGEGWLARRLADDGYEVRGFDGSAELVALARRLGGAEFTVLSFAEFRLDPQQVGMSHDTAVCNFSLLDESAGPLLAALHQVVRPAGSLLIQTLHPLALLGSGIYEDGWREERFEGMPGDWRPMPWYYRTVGSWLRTIAATGWRVEDCREPLHPQTGQPASLILRAARGEAPQPAES